MKVTGIIAEYNPFHNGHMHQLSQVKKDSDYLIIILSGDFTQRGEPAIVDKYVRTRMALECGADLVIELPVCYATADAKRFAYGGISLLNSLGVVDYLSFGIEPGCEALAFELSDFLINPPSEYEVQMATLIKEGHSYPTARRIALNDYYKEEQIALLSGSNMILALEYMSALKRSNSTIIPKPLTRLGSGYNDTVLNGSGLSSASAIRTAIAADGFNDDICSQLPSVCHDLLKQAYRLSLEDFSSFLHYKLMTTTDFTAYTDVEEDFSNRIISYKNNYKSYNDFIDTLKSKNITRTGVSRLLNHILLDMNVTPPTEVPYARILGFRKDSSRLLSEIKAATSIELITKLADATMCESLLADIKAADIYRAAQEEKYNLTSNNEYNKGIVII